MKAAKIKDLFKKTETIDEKLGLGQGDGDGEGGGAAASESQDEVEPSATA